MGFLFPLFLIAGIALIIPVLIHLFNLRRYKHVLFPNIRFLRQLQVASKRTAKIQKKWLLLTRLLFLAALVLAFARPYFTAQKPAKKGRSIRLIYLDNSLSMTAQKGAESLLQQAKSRARQLIDAAGPAARFVILSNNKMAATRPLAAAEALDLVQAVKPTPQIVDLNRIMESIVALQENEPNEFWRVYLFSDFQRATFLPAHNQVEKPEQVEFSLLPFQQKSLSNLYIDTAYCFHAGGKKGQENQLIVRIKESGKTGAKSSSLRVNVGDQTRAVRAVSALKNGSWTDTIPLQLNAGWQQITLILNDHPLNFDDTFRLAVQPAPDLSVLIVGENAVSPYLQSAFGSYEGFRMKWEPVSAIHPEDWQQYSLIILQNLDIIPDRLVKAVQERLEAGGSVLLFPGDSKNKTALNEALQSWGNIHFGALDTSTEQVVALQENQPVVQGLFEKIPENIQLPVTKRRFFIEADLTANQQSIMSFRDGSPFLAQYTPGKGRLFIVAVPLNVSSSNFPLSYFFVPVLYKMAVQNQEQNPPSIDIGSSNPVWINAANNAHKRSVWHLVAPSFDAVPVQNPSGTGTSIFVGQAATKTGFYVLKQEEGADSVWIALNTDRRESLLDYASGSAIEQSLKPFKVHWIDEKDISRHGWKTSDQPFPLWKIAVLIALLCLALETWLLLSGHLGKAVKK